MSIEYLPIESINFGVVPTLVESAEVVWVQSRFPPPDTLQVDEQVLLLNGNNQILAKFLVDDIIGTRIVLVPNDPRCFRMIKPSELCELTRRPRVSSRKGERSRNFRMHPLPGNSRVTQEIRDWVYGGGLSTTKLAFIPK